MPILTLLNALVSLCLALYAISAFVHAILYLRHRRRAVAVPQVPWSQLPSVAVQIPVYNELHVVERAIDAAAALRYPRDRLQVQIVDDSDDETTVLAVARAAYQREQGLDITVLRRGDRSGYKAGALAYATAACQADMIAIFDADFQPRPDFLLQTVPHLVQHADVAFVQARWSYVNGDYSPLTRAQELAFDGHHVIEQPARSRAGLLMIFNGAAGVWRRAAIEQAGGWQADTLCEDLDLSFRAQLAGWKPLHLPDVDVPGELPPEIAAFKQQQARWAQGTAQCLRKLGPRLLTSRRHRWWQKAMGLLHLCSYLSHPLAFLLAVLSLPMLLVPGSAQLPLRGLGLLYLGPPLVYCLSQQQLYRRWWRRLWPMPLLMLMGVGIAWTNTKASLIGLTRWGGPFRRTPKFELRGRTDDWSTSAYRMPPGSHVVGELALTAYALVTAAIAAALGQYAMLPFPLLYACAFGTVAALELLQSARRRPRASAAHATQGVQRHLLHGR